MSNKHTNFWLALLEAGDNAEERKQNWNQYLALRAPEPLQASVRNMLVDMNREELAESMFPRVARDASAWEKFEEFVEVLAEKHDGHPNLPSDPNFVGPAVMNFSGHQFCRDVSFAGRLLLFPSFDNASFHENADFRSAVFGGRASFDSTAFRGTKPGFGNGNLFDSAIFGNTASFTNASFSRTTNFSKAKFRSGAYFDDAKFQPPSGGALFAQSEFSTEASFKNAYFAVNAGFVRATFHEEANFQGASFNQRIIFNNVTFKAETSFRQAHFRTPPRFFEAKLHGDTDFGGVDWRAAEADYSRPWWKTLLCGSPWGQHDGSTKNADDAARAWDQLALIANKFERPHERHEFYRLRMRAQRQPGKIDPLSMMNRLFDVFCDYGWGFGRALSWWAGHIVAFAIILAICSAGGRSSPEPECGPAFGKGLLLSFANAHAILGLASQHGYLDGVRDCLESAVQPDWVMSTVGTFQAVVGPILLFLLLLTARNRFRLG